MPGGTILKVATSNYYKYCTCSVQSVYSEGH